MDELHEELKQTIIEDLEEKEEENHEEESHPIGQLVADRQLSMETSSTSSQSDADYETCDSLGGSERGSAEQNVSSDENSDVNELSWLNISPNASPRAKRLYARKMKKSLGKIEDTADETSEKLVSAKEEKEQLNMSKKATENKVMCSTEDVSVRTEGTTEFTDAVSETEPLQPPRKGSRKKSGTADREPVSRQAKSKYYKTASQSKFFVLW